MRILLFGEYSGFFNCLKDGLEKLGHTVFLASDGDGYKNYPSDFRWESGVSGRKGKVLDFIKLLKNRRLLKGYDVVHVISFRPLGFIPFINKFIIKYLRKHNGLVSVSGAGLDFQGFCYWLQRPQSKYYWYVNEYVKDAKNKGEKCPLLDSRLLHEERAIYNYIDQYIPIWYEYAEPYRRLSTLKKTIRIPINIEKFTYTPNIVDDKIVFFHGLTRTCKGGEYIQAAFERLSEKYADVAEFICDGGLPFDEYMEITSRANCILDDVNSYSFSMNALFAMARGKIYMGGAEPEGNKELEYEECPVINLTRDVDQICEAIEYVIANKNKIEEMGFASRKFVEKYHNHIDIACQYVECWENRK